MTSSSQTILLDRVRLDGDAACFAMEDHGSDGAGPWSAVRFYRVPRTEFEAMIRAYNALVYEEQDKP